MSRLQESEIQEIEEVAVVKQEQGHYSDTGEVNYEENYDANYYDDPGMMEYDGGQNIINSKGEKLKLASKVIFEHILALSSISLFIVTFKCARI